jgi:hypothetical protein
MPPFGPASGPTILHERCQVHHGVHDFSVQCAAGVEFAELAAWCPNRRVGVLTVSEVRGLGYDVVRTPGKGHHATVVVPAEWGRDAADILARSFRVASNPSPGARR